MALVHSPTGLSVDDALMRIEQEMAACHVQYDSAIADLKTQHARMGNEEKRLGREIEKLRPHVDGLLDGSGPGLTRDVARASLRYLGLLSKLHKTRQARRLAAGTILKGDTAPPLGKAVGTPPMYYENRVMQGNERKSKPGARLSKALILVKGQHGDLTDMPRRLSAKQTWHHAQRCERVAGRCARLAGNPIAPESSPHLKELARAYRQEAHIHRQRFLKWAVKNPDKAHAITGGAHLHHLQSQPDLLKADRSNPYSGRLSTNTHGRWRDQGSILHRLHAHVRNVATDLYEHSTGTMPGYRRMLRATPIRHRGTWVSRGPGGVVGYHHELHARNAPHAVAHLLNHLARAGYDVEEPETQKTESGHRMHVVRARKGGEERTYQIHHRPWTGKKDADEPAAHAPAKGGQKYNFSQNIHVSKNVPKSSKLYQYAKAQKTKGAATTALVKTSTGAAQVPLTAVKNKVGPPKFTGNAVTSGAAKSAATPSVTMTGKTPSVTTPGSPRKPRTRPTTSGLPMVKVTKQKI